MVKTVNKEDSIMLVREENDTFPTMSKDDTIENGHYAKPKDDDPFHHSKSKA